MIVQEKFKYILMFTMPSGAKFAAGGHNGNFALVPFQDSEVTQNILVWDDPDELIKWVKDFKSQIGDEEWGKLLRISPQIVKARMLH